MSRAKSSLFAALEATKGGKEVFPFLDFYRFSSAEFDLLPKFETFAIFFETLAVAVGIQSPIESLWASTSVLFCYL